MSSISGTDRLKFLAGTLFGTGLLPKAPGTAGSLVSLIAAYVLYSLIHPDPDPSVETEFPFRFPTHFQVGYFLLLTLLSALGVLWSAEMCENKWGKDPGPMVLDEAAGQLLVLSAIPLSGQPQDDWILLLTALLTFRLFDILKPLGIRSSQQFNGGFGILIDDIIAALYAILVIHLLMFFI